MTLISSQASIYERLHFIHKEGGIILRCGFATVLKFFDSIVCIQGSFADDGTCTVCVEQQKKAQRLHLAVEFVMRVDVCSAFVGIPETWEAALHQGIVMFGLRAIGRNVTIDTVHTHMFGLCNKQMKMNK